MACSTAAQTAAELVLVNAKIVTIDRKQPRAEAMAVRDGKIVALGSNSQVRRLAGPNTRAIDAGGRLVLPGFNDSHVHFTAIGNQFSHLDLRGFRSVEEIAAEIARYDRLLPRGRWIIGSGLGPDGIGSPDSLSLETLDKVSRDRPLIIYSEGKSAIANSAALKLASITAKTKNPSDGIIVRDGTGRPTGVFTGNAGALIRRHIPAEHSRNWAEIAETASNYAASLGITSVQDVHSDDLTETLRHLDRSGRLKTRVYECLGIDAWQKASRSHIGLVGTGCVKGTAFGIEEEIGELKQKVLLADKAGLHIAIHAIGSRSIRNAIDAFEEAAKTNPRRDRRHRIEHAARADPADRPRIAASKLIASMQPHLFYSGPEYGDDYRSIFDAGVTIALGSDASMTDFDPLLGISAAVNSGSRSLTVEQAVTAYTMNSAFAEFQEHTKGSLTPGKAADFVILSKDIFTIDPRQIPSAKVLLTAVDGKVVYDILDSRY